MLKYAWLVFILTLSCAGHALPWYCSKPRLKCMANGDGARRETLNPAYVADHRHSRCLIGGHFSYLEGELGARSCALPQSACTDGQVSCNASVFCLMDQRGAQASQCVDRAMPGNSEVEFCSAEFQLAQRGPGRLLGCDPRQRGLGALADATEKDFEVLCLNDPEFQRAYCGECQVLGDRIYEINQGSIERGCAPPVKHEWPDDSRVIHI